MPPRTRKQSSTKAADTSKQEPETEHAKGAEPKSMFSRLPPELQKTVVEYLTRPSDLRRLCLASKGLHALTLPHLYRDITLGTHQLHGDGLSLTSIANHPGLPHTRSLRIANCGYPGFDVNPNVQTLYKLLSALPKNGLRIFEFATTKEVDQRLGMFLRITQQNLINYQHHSIKSTIDPFFPSSDELRHVTCLQFFLKTKKDCRNTGMLIERTVGVTSLAIEPNNDALDYDIGRRGETGREVVNALFASSEAAHCGLKLRCLHIHRMSFFHAGTILPTVLHCNALEHLHLRQCSHTDRLCESLSQLNLTLRSFIDEGHDAQREDAHAIFLKSLSPLQSLHLTGSYHAATKGHEGFPWPTIVSHASSLRCLEIKELFLGHRNTASNNRIPLSFDAFCASASNLQQLSMAGPEFGKVTWASADGLFAFLECIRKIRTLRVLKLMVEPSCLSQAGLGRDIVYESDSEDAAEIREDFLDVKFELQSERASNQAKEMAFVVFNRLAPYCPWFVALAMELNSEEGDCIETVEYMRCKQTDAFGNATYVGLQVDEGTVKYYEPCCHDFLGFGDESML